MLPSNSSDQSDEFAENDAYYTRTQDQRAQSAANHHRKLSKRSRKSKNRPEWQYPQNEQKAQKSKKSKHSKQSKHRKRHSGSRNGSEAARKRSNITKKSISHRYKRDHFEVKRGSQERSKGKIEEERASRSTESLKKSISEEESLKSIQSSKRSSEASQRKYRMDEEPVGPNRPELPARSKNKAHRRLKKRKRMKTASGSVGPRSVREGHRNHHSKARMGRKSPGKMLEAMETEEFGGNENIPNMQNRSKKSSISRQRRHNRIKEQLNAKFKQQRRAQDAQKQPFLPKTHKGQKLPKIKPQSRSKLKKRQIDPNQAPMHTQHPPNAPQNPRNSQNHPNFQKPQKPQKAPNQGPKAPSSASSSFSEEFDEDKPQEIEKIIAKRTRDNKQQYKIKWKGWPIDRATWEPAENLSHLRWLITQFEREEGGEAALKKDRLLGSLKTGDVPLRIKEVNLAKLKKNLRAEVIEIDCCVEWRKRADGFKPGNSWVSNRELRGKFGKVLVEYYETKISS